MRDDQTRRALESRKTLSRKAKAKQVAATFPSDVTIPKPRSGPWEKRRTHSMGEKESGEDDSGLEDDPDHEDPQANEKPLEAGETVGTNWQEQLMTRISRIVDRNRKGGSLAGREEDLASMVCILRRRYARGEIGSRIEDLNVAFQKTIRNHSSEHEVLLTLEAIAMVSLTDPRDGMAYETWEGPLQKLIYDTYSLAVKREAISLLALVTFASCDDAAAESDIMPFFKSIIETDGSQISAEDSAEVVTAAIEGWCLLVTLLDDAQDATSRIIDTLVDQLSSTDPDVQIAAGQAIATVHEKSFTELEQGEEPPAIETAWVEPSKAVPSPAPVAQYWPADLQGGLVEVNDAVPSQTPLIQRYLPYQQKDRLLSTIASILKTRDPRQSKEARKRKSTSFASIHKSVTDPRLGPSFSDALDHQTGAHFGARANLKTRPGRAIIVDKWWKLVTLGALRRWLQGGFLEHYRRNELVGAMLPEGYLWSGRAQKYDRARAINRRVAEEAVPLWDGY